jgi:ABC-type nitrate/sulfonate/bicarbonate transport system permease component
VTHGLGAAQVSPGSRLRDLGVALRSTLLGVLGVVLALAAWQVLPSTGIVDASLFPRATAVLGAIPDLFRDVGFRTALRTSGGWWLAGVVLGCTVGIVLGTLMGRSRYAFLALNPLLASVYATPKVALVIPLVLFFGINAKSMVGTVLLGALVPVVTASFQGARRINQQYLWSAAAIGVPAASRLWRIVIPAALPDILSGIRVAIGFGILNLLGAEFVVRQGGVGAYLYGNLDAGQYKIVWAIGVVLAIIGFLLDLVYVRLVRLIFRWNDGTV